MYRSAYMQTNVCVCGVHFFALALPQIFLLISSARLWPTGLNSYSSFLSLFHFIPTRFIYLTLSFAFFTMSCTLLQNAISCLNTVLNGVCTLYRTYTKCYLVRILYNSNVKELYYECRLCVGCFFYHYYQRMYCINPVDVLPTEKTVFFLDTLATC